MASISSVLRSLGNERAVANVRTALDRPRREEWLVAGLLLRLEAIDSAIASDHPIRRVDAA